MMKNIIFVMKIAVAFEPMTFIFVDIQNLQEKNYIFYIITED